ncbi:tripartite tricarboxylate transporter substrate binding protein [Kineococcus sp. T13]|uniref:Bug family tripartite tricarboxylate transporter substrate binding protein n=1 Tax=Kineococcus vitellinus TaxID=2696565 RepID=UPI0014123D70|nr:tripartite tricarboxylate transporter substrate binding protein [Kineococcus vitellinus]NAZ76036.1 tripartite tricarboxylate transporter substrate binding protein [Kineococcus vitellinus]
MTPTTTTARTRGGPPRRALLTALAALPALAAAAAAAGCGVTRQTASSSGALTRLQLLVPNSPGGGYDTTGRSAVRVMEEVGAAEGVEVTNLSGAGGTVGLARCVSESGNPQYLMSMGLGVVGASYTNDVDVTLEQTTPVAQLIEEAGVVLVPAASPFATLGDLVAAWRSDPRALAVGGGSSPGGPDFLLPMQFADAVDVDPTEVNYIAYDGGGDLLPALLGGQIAFATSGYGELLDQITTGAVRALAVSSEQRVPVLDVPTLREQDVDLVFTNWRGLVAPPGLDDVEVARLVDALTQMHDSPQWRQVLQENSWTDAFSTGQAFGDFLEEQAARVREVLSRLGLV